MRNILLSIITVAFVAVSYSVQAQTEENVQFINHPYYNGSPLEKQRTKLTTKVRGLGYGGADSFFQIEGEKSSIRVHRDSVSFLIDFEQGAMGNLSLYRAEIEGRGKRMHRTIRFVKLRTFSSSDVGGETIPINLVRAGDGKYKIVPGEPLEPGEYSFIMFGATSGVYGESFSFGVDDVVDGID